MQESGRVLHERLQKALEAFTPQKKTTKEEDPYVLDELLEQNENLRQDKLSLETSNMVL